VKPLRVAVLAALGGLLVGGATVYFVVREPLAPRRIGDVGRVEVAETVRVKARGTLPPLHAPGQPNDTSSTTTRVGRSETQRTVGSPQTGGVVTAPLGGMGATTLSTVTGEVPPDTDPRVGQVGRGPATARGEVPPDSSPFPKRSRAVWDKEPLTARGQRPPPDTEPFRIVGKVVRDPNPATARGEVAPDTAPRAKGARVVRDPAPATADPNAPVPADTLP